MVKLGRTERISHKKSIAMAVSEKDWKRIEKAHDEDSALHSEFDSLYHEHAAPKEYKAMLEDPNVYQSVPGIGISKKMIHDVPQEEKTSTFMAKPYYPKLNSQTRSWVKHPIAGWSTMAAKALFNAGGMGDNIEKVYLHKHNNIPMTVHEFSKGYKTIYELADDSRNSGLNAPIRATPDPLEIKKIAVMDFLMGNNDRHGYNLMIASQANPTGHHPLLAIDHERNFQYDKSLNQVMNWKLGGGVKYGEPSDHPGDFLNMSALKDAHKASYKTSPEDLQEWWEEHSDSIRQAFEKQLVAIKNPRIRNHVKKNFDQRFAIIDKWATPGEENGFENVDLFSKEFPYKAYLQKIQKAPKEKLEILLNRLPEDPSKAAITLSEISKRKKGLAAENLVRSLFKELLQKMSPEQAVTLYESVRKDTSKKIGRNPLSTEILWGVYKTGNKNQALAFINWDNGKGLLNHFWVNRFEDLIDGE